MSLFVWAPRFEAIPQNQDVVDVCLGSCRDALRMREQRSKEIPVPTPAPMSLDILEPEWLLTSLATIHTYKTSLCFPSFQANRDVLPFLLFHPEGSGRRGRFIQCKCDEVTL